MHQEKKAAGSLESRRSKRSNMTDRGMVSLLRAVEVATATPPPAHDRPPRAPRTSNSKDATPNEPRKGARVFSAEEKVKLQHEYALNKFPTRQKMADIAKELSKQPDKVRTWFNNRRAHDRKMGNEVVRNPVVRPPQNKENETSSSTSDLDEDVRSPGESSIAPGPSPSQPKPQNNPPLQRAPKKSKDTHSAKSGTNSGSTLSQAKQKKENQASVRVSPTNRRSTPSRSALHTPESSQIASVISPVTDERRASEIQSPLPTGRYVRSQGSAKPSSSRGRILPVKLRAVRLRLGETELCGEGHESSVGLEVKFLFGKKRLVYEWYCGTDFSKAQTTGGPYAKVEINFDSLYTMRFERTRSGSIIEMTLSDTPALFRQAEHNMNKFKARSQQRQYEKATPQEFSENITSKDHRILLRSDEAARVKKIILESVPELASLVLASEGPSPSHFPPGVLPKAQAIDTESVSAGVKIDAPGFAGSDKSIAEAGQTPITCKRAPFGQGRVAESSFQRHSPGQQNSNRTPLPPRTVTSRSVVVGESSIPKEKNTPISTSRQRGQVIETPTLSSSRFSSAVAIEPAVSSRQAENPILATSTAMGPSSPFTTPISMHSPGTPFTSGRTHLGGSTGFWHPSGFSATPTMDQSGTPSSAEQVRRALDFTYRGMKTPVTGRKRPYSEANDENDASINNKHARTGPCAPVFVGNRVLVPAPPMPPPLPPPPPPPLPSRRAKEEKLEESKESEKQSSEPADNPDGSKEVQLPR